MDVVREGLPVARCGTNCPLVSILVLMDVVREDGHGVVGPERAVGFNPCSNGCRSGS